MLNYVVETIKVIRILKCVWSVFTEFVKFSFPMVMVIVMRMITVSDVR